jgi:hypothetical protein
LQCPPLICPETPAWSKTDRVAADPYNVASGPCPSFSFSVLDWRTQRFASSVRLARHQSQPSCQVTATAERLARLIVRYTQGHAGLALGIERVEFKVEVMLGRFTRMDRAAKDLSFRLARPKTCCLRRSHLSLVPSIRTTSRRLDRGSRDNCAVPFGKDFRLAEDWLSRLP